MNAREAIKKAMKSKGVTQTQIADALGLGQSSIAMFLTRDLGMRVENLLKMANACGYELALVDRDASGNAIVIGDTDEIRMGTRDGELSRLVREIVASELKKREVE